MEVYRAYGDISDMLELTQGMILHCLKEVSGSDATLVHYQGAELDFSAPFRRVPMSELVREACGWEVAAYKGDLVGAKAAACAALQAAGLADHMVGKSPSVGHVLNVLFEELVEAGLQNPTFVLEHPLEISPLSKPHRDVDGVAERFELFIAGRELANSFSELTDPVDQRRRLEAQVRSLFPAHTTLTPLANSFSELTDPVDQRRRLEAQASL